MKAIRKKTIKKKTILWCTGVLILILAYGLILYLFTAYYMAAHAARAAGKEFVEYLILHSDEAAADFEADGLTFEKAEEEIDTGTDMELYEIILWGAGETGDVLIVTDADGWRFYYQTSEKYGDRFLKIEGSVERIDMLAGKSKTITGRLVITEDSWSKNYAYVGIDAVNAFEIFTLSYRLPEFDDYRKTYRAEDAAPGIGKWISNEELAALYKKGKALEEILSTYCELKRHNVDISIHFYEPE